MALSGRMVDEMERLDHTDHCQIADSVCHLETKRKTTENQCLVIAIL